MIDLISDTVTLPSQEMLQTVLTAPLGDAGRLDRFGRGGDPTTNELEDLAAELTGMEAAAFFPTGTIANTAALLSCCKRGEKVAVETRQHLWITEQICFQEELFGLIPVPYGLDQNKEPDREQLRQLLDREDIRLVCLENTHNFSGGTCISRETMDEIWTLCAKRHIPIHLDGARLFNAAEALQIAVSDITRYCSSVMFCVSKGLGAPIGSLLCGSETFISRAREARKLLGGTMRQSGVAAACGLYALRRNVSRLREDRQNAQHCAALLTDLQRIRIDTPPQSNILLFDLRESGITGEDFCGKLEARGIRGSLVSEFEVRLVFHMGISRSDAAYAAESILAIDAALPRCP